MRFTIEKEVFLRGLGRIQGIVEKRTTIPILSNVLIEASDHAIKLTATDLEVGMLSSFPATVTETGKVTVAAKKLFEIVKELPEKEISFSAKENCWIEIRCGKSLFNIVGLAAEEFPAFPHPEEGQFLTLSSADLKTMLEKTAFSMSNDEKKFTLNGIYVKTTEENGQFFLRLVATDGHRLTLIQQGIPSLQEDDFQKGVILPRKGVMELRKIAEEGDSPVFLGLMDNNAIVKKDQTVAVMRLVDGEFPNYSRVIPEQTEHAAIIPTDTVLHALRRISLLSNEKSRGVKILLTEGLMEISSSNPDFGDAREELEIDYQGPEIAIGFNARFLMDIFQNQHQPQLRLMLKNETAPGLIMPLDSQDYLAVVMPMRL